MSIRRIIESCGTDGTLMSGAEAIQKASEGTDKEMTLKAIYRWQQLGIPEWHWPLIRSLNADITVDQLHAANEFVRRKKKKETVSRK